MRSLLVLVALLFALLLPIADARRCYNGTSTTNKKKDYNKVDCDSSYSCYKYIFSIGGKTGYMKGCSIISPLQGTIFNVSSGCSNLNTLGVLGISATYCGCNKDLCNGASDARMSSSLPIAIVTACFAAVTRFLH